MLLVGDVVVVVFALLSVIILAMIVAVKSVLFRIFLYVVGIVVDS